jgi:hypothetical protein
MSAQKPPLTEPGRRLASVLQRCGDPFRDLARPAYRAAIDAGMHPDSAVEAGYETALVATLDQLPDYGKTMVRKAIELFGRCAVTLEKGVEHGSAE